MLCASGSENNESIYEKQTIKNLLVDLLIPLLTDENSDKMAANAKERKIKIPTTPVAIISGLVAALVIIFEDGRRQ